MKNINFEVFCTLMLIFSMSCTNNTKHNKCFIVSGHIDNFQQDSLHFYKNSKKWDYWCAKVSKSGDFRDTVILSDKIVPYALFVGVPTTVYLKNGMDLNISFKFGDISSLKFIGKGSDINNYFFEKGKLSNFLSVEVVSDANKYVSTIKNVRDKLLSNIASVKGISEEYRQAEVRNIKYRYYTNLVQYKDRYKRFMKKELNKLPKNFYDDLKNADLKNEADFKIGYTYAYFLQSYYKLKAEEIGKDDSFKHFHSYFIAVNTNSDNFIKNTLIYREATQVVLASKNISVARNVFDEFKKYCTDKKMISKLTEIFNNKFRFVAGTKSPDFNNYENYAGGTSSLKDFRGKYVFIDCWATWCAICIEETPYLKKIEKLYKDKNIVFIGISLDRKSDRSKWRKKIKKDKMDGIQLLCDNAFKSEFIKGYLIQGIPRFILLDPQGNIVSSDAPRPSDKANLIKLFDSVGL